MLKVQKMRRRKTKNITVILYWKVAFAGLDWTESEIGPGFPSDGLPDIRDGKG